MHLISKHSVQCFKSVLRVLTINWNPFYILFVTFWYNKDERGIGWKCCFVQEFDRVTIGAQNVPISPDADACVKACSQLIEGCIDNALIQIITSFQNSLPKFINVTNFRLQTISCLTHKTSWFISGLFGGHIVGGLIECSFALALTNFEILTWEIFDLEKVGQGHGV